MTLQSPPPTTTKPHESLLTPDGTLMDPDLCSWYHVCEFMNPVVMPCPEDVFHHPFPISSSCFDMPSFSSSFLFPELGKSDVGVPLKAEHSVFSYSQYFNWLSLCINWQQKLFWPRLRVALIYGHKHKYLKGSLKPFKLVIIIIVVVVARNYDLPSHESLIRFIGMNYIL